MDNFKLLLQWKESIQFASENSVIWLIDFSRKSSVCSDLVPSAIDNRSVSKWKLERRKKAMKAPIVQTNILHIEASDQILKKYRGKFRYFFD